jgi:RHS repeat-associated protein
VPFRAGDPHKIPIDPNGNLTTKTEGTDTWGYEWNARNQLTRVTKNSVEQARFAYDPLGRRVEKVEGGVTTSYTYQVAEILREVRDSTTLKYVHDIGVDGPLLVDDTTGVSYFYADGLASVSKIINQAGVATLEREYDPWGNLQSGSSQPGYAFTGREWDPEAGLYYYRARYYDPATGRFVSEDPIRFDAGPNFYLYVDANPVSGTDPLGLWGQNSEPRVPRPPRMPPRDWCGSRGTEWIPDFIWPYYDFTEPCEIHDKCYETCGKSKAQCDFEFLQNMQKKCRWKPPLWVAL